MIEVGDTIRFLGPSVRRGAAGLFNPAIPIGTELHVVRKDGQHFRARASHGNRSIFYFKYSQEEIVWQLVLPSEDGFSFDLLSEFVRTSRKGNKNGKSAKNSV